MKPLETTPLSLDAADALREVGRLLAEARARRRVSASALARRVGVDRRTIANLEAGQPTVAVGTLFQVLDVLGLLRGVEEVVRPENDLEAVRAEVHRARARGRRAPRIADEKADF